MGKYYEPSEYERMKNAALARRNQNSTDIKEEYSIYTDERFYSEIQAENQRFSQQNDTNPKSPQPPANVVNNFQEQIMYNSVYDSIAEKRKKKATERISVNWDIPDSDSSIEKSKGNNIGFNNDMINSREAFAEDIVYSHTEKITAEDVEKKIYNQTPVTEEELQLFLNRISDSVADDDEEEFYTKEDIIGMCEFYRKKYSRKMWITLICCLCVFCGMIVTFYLYINGYLDIFFAA